MKHPILMILLTQVLQLLEGYCFLNAKKSLSPEPRHQQRLTNMKVPSLQKCKKKRLHQKGRCLETSNLLESLGRWESYMKQYFTNAFNNCWPRKRKPLLL